MEKHFPAYTKCNDQLKTRFTSLTKSFKERYEAEPEFFVHTPGRVNLIGEHIDYNGYSVCPMAIEQSFVAAVKAISEPEVKVSNVDSKTYKDHISKIDHIEIENKKTISWHNYVLCGIKGILESVPKKELKGFILHVEGTIPPAAGLSSSSALVCTAALATAILVNANLSKLEITELTAKAEYYIGTEGGAMDQAIIFNGKNGMAIRISFDPLHLTDVHIPSSGKFVIAQSMVTKNKAASTDFNLRVVECRLASLIIAKQQNLKNWQQFTKLSNVQNGLKSKLEEMIKLVDTTFHDGVYTKSEVTKILGIDETELEEKFLTANTKNLTQFKLKPRALHVFGEALRTETFCKVCTKSKSLSELGRVMNESHNSLRDLYECSHPELDKLVSTCNKNGALGARLTGAGWGGCVVALVEAKAADVFVDKVKKSFYKNKPSENNNMSEKIFVTESYNGASVFSSSIKENK